MTTGYNVLLRNAQLDAITTFAGAGALLRIYNGTRPATGGAATTLLYEGTCGAPFAPAAAAGALSPTQPADIAAVASGTATWWRVVKADGTTHVMDGGVGSDMTLNSNELASGVNVDITGWTVIRGNA